MTLFPLFHLFTWKISFRISQNSNFMEASTVINQLIDTVKAAYEDTD